NADYARIVAEGGDPSAADAAAAVASATIGRQQRLNVALDAEIASAQVAANRAKNAAVFAEYKRLHDEAERDHAELAVELAEYAAEIRDRVEEVSRRSELLSDANAAVGAFLAPESGGLRHAGIEEQYRHYVPPPAPEPE